tara:strand:- start:118 stop:588 length:471 start_codon:yes stop_codon:yes gene_type:complete
MERIIADKIIDYKIESLVEFINSLKGVETLGSCQGHDNGGQTGEWVYPYIKFKCLNDRSLGLLASIEYIYSDLRKLYGDVSEEELLKIYQPKLKGIWTIEVLPNIDYHLPGNDGEYAVFVLKAHMDSFEKPSEVYPDFDKILDWYKRQLISSLNRN